MVKLFVGGLPDGVDSIRLRQLFSQFVIVNECDVIKDYAFVHVATEEHARTAIEKLDGYILEGKSINIRWSTSKLRKEPGGDKRCYRCGSADHKTPFCPTDQANAALKRDGSGTSLASTDVPDAKRFAQDMRFPLDGQQNTAYAHPITVNLTGRSDAPQNIAGYPYHQGGVTQQQTNSSTNARPDNDPELPRPIESDLILLYDQYMDARVKYFYFRERLSKELKARTCVPTAAGPVQMQPPFVNGTYAAPPPATLHYESAATAPAYSNVVSVAAPYSSVAPAAPYSSGQHYYAGSVSAPYQQQQQLQLQSQDPQVLRLY